MAQSALQVARNCRTVTVDRRAVIHHQAPIAGDPATVTDHRAPVIAEQPPTPIILRKFSPTTRQSPLTTGGVTAECAPAIVDCASFTAEQDPLTVEQSDADR